MKTNPHELAMPSHEALEDRNSNHLDKRNRISGGGLTKREYFAALAMQGFADRAKTMCSYDMDATAIMSVLQADALIAQLNRIAK